MKTLGNPTLMKCAKLKEVIQLRDNWIREFGANQLIQDYIKVHRIDRKPRHR